MKKLKKLIILTMAITTLLGATLTVNAAHTSTPACHYCGLLGPVVHSQCNGDNKPCQWYCQKCYMYFTNW